MGCSCTGQMIFLDVDGRPSLNVRTESKAELPLWGENRGKRNLHTCCQSPSVPRCLTSMAACRRAIVKRSNLPACPPLFIMVVRTLPPAQSSKEEALTPKVSASFSTIRIVGLRAPRSISLT